MLVKAASLYLLEADGVRLQFCTRRVGAGCSIAVMINP